MKPFWGRQLHPAYRQLRAGAMHRRVDSQNLLTLRVSIVLFPDRWATEAYSWRMKEGSLVKIQEHPGIGSHGFKDSETVPERVIHRI